MDETMLKNIEKYHAGVKMLFDRNSPEIFPNNNEEHTAAIIEEIFLHAKEEVKILCCCLKNDVWNTQGVKTAFINAFCRGVKFKIITQKTMDDKTFLAGMIKELQIPLRENMVPTQQCNFIVSDKKMFRFEENSSERHASASANCPDVAMPLNDLFDRIFAL